ncbi:MAG: hypothetical protein IPM35_26430 [Myxococcales bacterium]|nr:hypothetical protein [Myxococcales bacterium]
MSTREERVLGLAREAWRAGEPSEARVELAARRIERKMRRGRSRPARRHTLVLAFLVVFGGALAYAASGGGKPWFGERPRETSGAKLGVAARGGLGVAVEESARRARADVPAALPAAPPAAADEPLAIPKAAAQKPAASPAPAASWRAVDEALDAKDDARAKLALEGLAKSSDATTRAKARLGLAQLAKSKGDCATAKRIAAEITGQEGVEPSVVKRARALASECE